eukprot:CAMPEP_0179409814 /NCGR_PEP_ID=MMETSP0799-20121207/2920_1 /TAXON_ID=46947 /ORGANISM="Geminigera cryophila, Strain CCMP2564" /LENGTH=197 /DNA_ID=CAMNT_0021181553 /DNA_START=165 /DNA_END=758 /DNA_ORIENTATION=-
MEKFNTPGMYDALSRLDLQEGETLLEICTGPGLGMEEALLYKGVTVVGVDISNDMVHMARTRNSQAIALGRGRIELASVQDLSFLPSASVDKIFHMNCIYFWPDLPMALKELFRVLKPKGRMLAATKFGQVQHFNADKSIFRNTNESVVVAALSDAGFRQVEKREVHLGSSCTGKNARSGCAVDERMHYAAFFASKL